MTDRQKRVVSREVEAEVSMQFQAHESQSKTVQNGFCTLPVPLGPGLSPPPPCPKIWDRRSLPMGTRRVWGLCPCLVFKPSPFRRPNI